MDPFHHDNDNVEAEQAGENGRFGSLARAFRTIELCLALFFALWLFIRLPFVFKILTQLLHRLVLIVITPCVTFMIFAVIAIVFMVKSFRVSNRDIGQDNMALKFYEHMVNTSATYVFEAVDAVYEVADHMQMKRPFSEEDEEEYEDKEIISEENTATPICEIDDDVETECREMEIERRVHELHLSEIVTETKETERVGLCPKNQLSMEDFNKAIEDFITKQHEVHRQERRNDYMESLIHNKSIAIC